MALEAAGKVRNLTKVILRELRLIERKRALAILRAYFKSI